MPRKLASIQRVVDIKPIEGADRIELATFLGWNVIVKKGEFKIGDLGVYIEYDSLLPVDNPNFEFLHKSCYSPKYNAYRIRCMKMKGVFSQGIAFPLSILPISYLGLKHEGSDVTDLLRITKYDPEAWEEEHGIKNKFGKGGRSNYNFFMRFILRFKWFKNIFFPKRKEFPTMLLSITDETRIQAVPNVLTEYKGTQCYITEKIDGCSFTAVMHKGKFDVYSRSMCMTNSNSHWWRVEEKYKIKEKLKKLGLNNIALQGEVVGEGVGNGSGCNLYNTIGNDLYVFNVIDLKIKKQYSLNDMVMLCNELGLKTVPILQSNYVLGVHTVGELLELSKGKSVLLESAEREGIVIRDLENKFQPIRGLGDHLSFKVINPDFIMKHQDKERKENN